MINMLLNSHDDLTEKKFNFLMNHYKKMKLTFPEALTADNYDDEAKEYAHIHKNRDFLFNERNTFMKYISMGKILEIGSGGGGDAGELLDLGFDYVGVDVSKKLLVQAKQLEPEGIFYHQSVYNLDFPDSSFDGFWFCRVLHHIPKARVKEALANVRRVVRTNGIGFVATVRGEGEEFFVTPTAQRYYSYYSKEELRDILVKNGFDVLNFKVRRIDRKEALLIFFVRIIK
jgi:SAM-dependent methyltransferase